MKLATSYHSAFNLLRPFGIAMALCLLLACGQKGPLILPQTSTADTSKPAPDQNAPKSTKLEQSQ